MDAVPSLRSCDRRQLAAPAGGGTLPTAGRHDPGQDRGRKGGGEAARAPLLAAYKAQQQQQGGGADGAAAEGGGGAGAAAEAEAAADAEPKCARLPVLSKRMVALCARDVLGGAARARGGARQAALQDLRVAVVSRAAELRPDGTRVGVADVRSGGAAAAY